MSRNSKLILSKNIKLDKQYKEVLNYTELQMLDLLNSEEHLVNRDDKFSFLRENTNVISTGFSYAECLQANYIAFTNPDYSNKWFFAFVDDVIYVSDKVTEIHFTIDVMSTWFNKVNVEQCFVIREHTMNDTAGSNLLPEDVELGEYVFNGVEDVSELYDLCPVISMNYDPTIETSESGLFHGNVYQGYGFYIVKGALATSYSIADQINAINSLMQYLAKKGKADSILSMFMAPKKLVDWQATGVEWTICTEDGVSFACRRARFSNESAFNIIDKSINKPTSLDSYVPVNKKLLTWPYSFLNVNNNSGNDITFRYEFFSNNSITFNIDGVICPSCNIKAIPNNYKNVNKNYSESVNGGKYPICSYNSDVYINWLTQEAINIPLNFITSGISTATSLIGKNPIGAGAGLVSIVSSIGSIYEHSLTPIQTQGNTNSGDINVSENKCTFTFEKMSISSQQAKIIDEYFTRFGYKTNLTKVPNINGRTYFNYVQIADSEVIGYGEVPNKYMDEINNIFRKGVTIWHDHSNIGDYTVNNSIVTP